QRVDPHECTGTPAHRVVGDAATELLDARAVALRAIAHEQRVVCAEPLDDRHHVIGHWWKQCLARPSLEAPAPSERLTAPRVEQCADGAVCRRGCTGSGKE